MVAFLATLSALLPTLALLNCHFYSLAATPNRVWLSALDSPIRSNTSILHIKPRICPGTACYNWRLIKEQSTTALSHPSICSCYYIYLVGHIRCGIKCLQRLWCGRAQPARNSLLLPMEMYKTSSFQSVKKICSLDI